MAKRAESASAVMVLASALALACSDDAACSSKDSMQGGISLPSAAPAFPFADVYVSLLRAADYKHQMRLVFHEHQDICTLHAGLDW